MRFKDLYEKVSMIEPKQLNVVNPEAESVFWGLKEAVNQGYVNLRLFGKQELIEKQSERIGLKGSFICDCRTPVDAAKEAVKDIRHGNGELLMKGDIPTADFLRPVIDRDDGLRKGSILSHVAVCDTPNYPRLLFVADGGINIAPDLETKKVITESTIEFAEKVLGEKPKIAFAAVIEKINEKIPSTVDASILAEIFRNKGYIAEGPISMDILLSPEAARKKGFKSDISGGTDVIIFPEITPCNFMIKQMILLENAIVGGLVLNAAVPIVVLSRSDTAETKLNSILLSLL